ncbi:hypothetical protein N7468_009818 [Penicillium chermesinum]|uniref:Lytic polysaccharide monooxygenase n=1 Tax=Penicillium chermesinum TaxID=63820 RepID=A0A9W9NBH7_9EURO|nr:uncharacterized protein N7468_009818 [Penicillium chermesinum]KAJ5216810.1 hypothetical protein N7468_009818 [Penicillium chermesinum]KAJ6171571.1 hypothetical protein N7470_000638 [Penicillium chermesinum]
MPTSRALGLLMLLSGWARAHMILTSPEPFGRDTLNNSPLAADGSDFPCKLRSGAFELPAEQAMIAVGETYPLILEGSATHGGGSCQISLTTDRIPSKESKWMVIKSFEGGCPANVEGNLAGGATAVHPFGLEFAIPRGIDPGNYTLAWTWFNRIGNREMYMNCAPITIIGGSTQGLPEELSSFPPMFIANINGCITAEGVDIRFPQPGNTVERKGEPGRLAPPNVPVCSGVPRFGDTETDISSSSPI